MKISQLARLWIILLIGVCLFSCEDEEAIEPIPAATNGLVAHAGSDKVVKVDSHVSLDGTGSRDKNKQTFSYYWEFKSKPESSEAILLLENSAKPSFSPDVVGTYVILLKISQGSFSATDEVTVTANENSNPGPVTVRLSESVESDKILTDIIQDPTQPDYIVTTNLYINATLKVEAGVTIAFERHAGLTVMQGSLIAIGTPEAPITMKGVENDPGFWKGVVFHSNNPSNEINYATIDAAGSTPDPESGAASGITLIGSDISGASLSMANTTVKRSGGYGVYAFGSSSLPAFSVNNFIENTKAPVYASANMLTYLDTDSNYGNNNGVNAIETAGVITGINEVIKRLPVPYRVVSDIDVAGGVSIEAGARFHMAANVAINVQQYGFLEAIGTEANRIVFTSIATNIFWKGILFGSGSDKNTLRYVDISNAGSNKLSNMEYAANVAVAYQGKLSVFNSRITNGKGYGLVTGMKERVNQDLVLVNEFTGLAKGWVYPSILMYPDRPSLHGEWVDQWTFNKGYASIDESFYNKQSGVWFGGATNPWGMNSGKGMGLKLTEDGEFIWTIAEPSPMSGCESWSAEYITGAYHGTDETIVFAQDYWRSKFINSCDPSQNVDTGVTPIQLQLKYEYVRSYNMYTGEMSWQLKFTNPDNSTFVLYRKN